MSLGSDFEEEFVDIMMSTQSEPNTVGRAISRHVSDFCVSAGYGGEYAFGMSAVDFLSLAPTELDEFLSKGQFQWVSVFEAALLLAIAYDFTHDTSTCPKTLKSLDQMVRRLGGNGYVAMKSMDRWLPEQRPSLRMFGSGGRLSNSKVGVEVSSVLLAIKADVVGMYCTVDRDERWLGDIDAIVAAAPKEPDDPVSIDVVDCQSLEDDGTNDVDDADDRVYIVLAAHDGKTASVGVYMSQDEALATSDVVSRAFDLLDIECNTGVIYAPFFK